MSRGKSLKKLGNEKSGHYKVDDIDYDELPPTFSFYHMQYSGRYCISKCERDDRSDIAHKLVLISQRTWKEIASDHRKALGYEKIPIKRFRPDRFPDIVTPEVNSLTVFAYSHGGRMVGIRQRDIFHVIFVGDDIYEH